MWVVTFDGSILLRNEVSSREPSGNKWIEIKSTLSFVSISSNSNLAFALDTRGFVYLRNLSENDQEGKMWVRILKGLSSISVSLSNQVLYFM